MSYTMADYRRDKFIELWTKSTPEEREEALRDLPLEERLAGISPREIAAYLKKRQLSPPARKGKPRRGS